MHVKLCICLPCTNSVYLMLVWHHTESIWQLSFDKTVRVITDFSGLPSCIVQAAPGMSVSVVSLAVDGTVVEKVDLSVLRTTYHAL